MLYPAFLPFYWITFLTKKSIYFLFVKLIYAKNHWILTCYQIHNCSNSTSVSSNVLIFPKQPKRKRSIWNNIYKDSRLRVKHSTGHWLFPNPSCKGNFLTRIGWVLQARIATWHPNKAFLKNGNCIHVLDATLQI